MQNFKLPQVAFSLLFVLGLAPNLAQAQEYCPARGAPQAFINPDSRNANLKGPVHPSAVSALSCVVKGLAGAGLPVKTLWGYGCRPLRLSNHPRGLAVDVDQYARDKTNPVVDRALAAKVAASCGVTSASYWPRSWGGPDNGHFEVHSMSRAQQAQKAPSTKRVAQRRTRKQRTVQRQQQNPWFWN